MIGNSILKNLKENYSKEIKTGEDAIGETAFMRRQILVGDIELDTGAAVEAVIRFWNQIDDENELAPDDREPIKIFIDSCGGDLGATFTIIDAIKMSKTPVYTINVGCALSGGFFTLLAGHKRFAYPHAAFLFHEGSISTQGATSGQFENQAQFYKRQLAKIKDFVLEHTNISEEEYNEIKREDIWYDSDEAIEKGIIDEVLTSLIN
jgi:ATP-dependent Clp protease protease subunit